MSRGLTSDPASDLVAQIEAVLDLIATRGPNQAPIPLAFSYELNADNQMEWAAYVDVRHRAGSFDLVTAAASPNEMMAKVLLRLKREMP